MIARTGRFVLGWLVWCGLAVVACSSTTNSTPPETEVVVTATPTPVTPSPTQSAPPVASPPAPNGDPAGTWSSASCGDRKYERIITLAKQNTFQSWDRVSPCPANAKCIWSGIVERSGAWKMFNTKLTLEPSGDEQKAGVALPSSFTFEDNELSESANGTKCLYTRQ